MATLKDEAKQRNDLFCQDFKNANRASWHDKENGVMTD